MSYELFSFEYKWHVSSIIYYILFWKFSMHISIIIYFRSLLNNKFLRLIIYELLPLMETLHRFNKIKWPQIWGCCNIIMYGDLEKFFCLHCGRRLVGISDATRKNISPLGWLNTSQRARFGSEARRILVVILASCLGIKLMSITSYPGWKHSGYLVKAVVFSFQAKQINWRPQLILYSMVKNWVLLINIVLGVHTFFGGVGIFSRLINYPHLKIF